jgi:hypothetical protein
VPTRRATTRGAIGALAISGVTTLASLLPAQHTIDFDLTWTQRYVVRGQVLVSLPTVQPGAWLATAVGDIGLSVGGSGLLETREVRGAEFSLRADRGPGLAAWEVWVEGTRSILDDDVTIGASRFHFTTDDLPDLATSPYAELYLAIERGSDVPLTEGWWYQLRYWHGIESSATRSIELAVGPHWLLLPIRDVTFGLITTTALNLATPDPVERGLGAAMERGVTHVELAAIVTSVPHCDDASLASGWRRMLDWLAPRQAAIRTQFARDAATRWVDYEREKAWFASVEVIWAPRECAGSR